MTSQGPTVLPVALDAMGGDNAPRETCAGAVLASAAGIPVTLVGQREVLEAELGRQCGSRGLPEGITLVHAESAVAMDEHPADAVRSKRESSVMVACELVRSERASAVVSAGNTGAAYAAALIKLRRIPGVDRPAIAVPFPTQRGATLLLDVGANVDSKPEHLVWFARMGSIYARHVLGIDQPTVGLLNIGEEESKGNELAGSAYRLLKGSGLDFVGNVEGKDIPAGAADVVVCDGFVGNVVLKLAEGLSKEIVAMIRSGVKSSPIAALGGLLLAPVFKQLKRKLDYSEYGGAPLLGVGGVCIIAHGRSDRKAIMNAIKAAHRAAAHDIVGAIRSGVGL